MRYRPARYRRFIRSREQPDSSPVQINAADTAPRRSATSHFTGYTDPQPAQVGLPFIQNRGRRGIWVRASWTPIVGRDRELALARQFVVDAVLGPAALVFEGVAGIGKTAIWSAAVRDARADGVAVRVCRCSESDTAWAFAGLGDLFEVWIRAILAALPTVQQRALSAALLLSDGAEHRSGQSCRRRGRARGAARAGSAAGRYCWRWTTSSGWTRARAMCCPSRCGAWWTSRCG